MLQNLLFPQLKGKWIEVNMNEIALQHNLSADAPSSVDTHWVTQLLQGMGADYCYGGYMEHRDFLLRNQYNKDAGPDHFWHLGIDYTVPENTEVHLPVDAFLIHHHNNGDQNGGWGGMLKFKLKDGFLILGHLSDYVTEMRLYKKGDVVAKVGPREVNGGWFPHLHVQRARIFNSEVDGYSPRYDGIELDFPNPETLCKLSA